MDNAELVAALNALPEQSRLAIERLVDVLKKQAPVRRLPPIMRSSEPLTEEEKHAEQTGKNPWANRTDITDGSEYIHAVRRGTRQP
jgi:hypothetical protein